MESPIMVVIIVVLLLLTLVLFAGVYKNMERFQLGWYSTASADPVSYDARARRYDPNGTYIRRWRTPVPVGAGARQVSDDVWARTYAPGSGFQLG